MHVGILEYASPAFHPNVIPSRLSFWAKMYGYGMPSLWLWNVFSMVMECLLYGYGMLAFSTLWNAFSTVMECLLYGYGMPSLWLWNAFSMVMEHSQSILLLIRCSLLPHLQSGEW